MNPQNFALFTKKINIDQINKITKYINSLNSFYHFHIFYDGDCLENIEESILPSFYMKFYKGSLIFDSADEYLNYYNKILSSNIYITIDDTANKSQELPHQNHQSLQIFCIT
jgi:hypothetical protein